MDPMSNPASSHAHPSVAEDARARDLVRADASDSSALARLIDHTLLKPDARAQDIDRLCADAHAHGFRSVCVPPAWVTHAAGRLAGEGSRVLTCTVVGFPLGYNALGIKASEARLAVEQGAQEIDYVLHAPLAREKDFEGIAAEGRAIVQAAQGRLVKVILETSLLTPDEIFASSLHAARAGVHVIKTSTGFGARGASREDIATIARALAQVAAETGRTHGIKASGGVRTRQDALFLVEAGATRLGTSGGVAILSGGDASSHQY